MNGDPNPESYSDLTPEELEREYQMMWGSSKFVWPPHSHYPELIKRESHDRCYSGSYDFALEFLENLPQTIFASPTFSRLKLSLEQIGVLPYLSERVEFHRRVEANPPDATEIDRKNHSEHVYQGKMFRREYSPIIRHHRVYPLVKDQDAYLITELVVLAPYAEFKSIKLSGHWDDKIDHILVTLSALPVDSQQFWPASVKITGLLSTPFANNVEEGSKHHPLEAIQFYFAQNDWSLNPHTLKKLWRIPDDISIDIRPDRVKLHQQDRYVYPFQEDFGLHLKREVRDLHLLDSEYRSATTGKSYMIYGHNSVANTLTSLTKEPMRYRLR